MNSNLHIRLRTLEKWLRQKGSEGLTTAEIAQEFGISRQTAWNDINRLSLINVPIFEEGRRYFIVDEPAQLQDTQLKLPFMLTDAEWREQYQKIFIAKVEFDGLGGKRIVTPIERGINDFLLTDFKLRKRLNVIELPLFDES